MRNLPLGLDEMALTAGSIAGYRPGVEREGPTDLDRCSEPRWFGCGVPGAHCWRCVLFHCSCFVEARTRFCKRWTTSNLETFAIPEKTTPGGAGGSRCPGMERRPCPEATVKP